MRKISKKNQKEFIDNIERIIENSGAKLFSDGHMKKYRLNTRVGDLIIIKPLLEETSLYSIYTRFKNVDIAKKIFDCNEFNGKYNFHLLDMEDCIVQFNHFIATCKV